MAEIELEDGSQSVNQPIKNSLLVNEFGVDKLGIIRNNELYPLPSDDFFSLQEISLKVKRNVECLQKLKASKVRIREEIKDLNLESKETSLVELVITTNSRYEGKTLQGVNFRERYNAVPLAIRHREEVINERLMRTTLRAGDVVLVEIKNDRLEDVKDEEYHQNQPFLLIGEYTNNIINWRNFAIVFTCIAGIVLVSAFNIMHVVGGALIASCILLVTGCLKVEEIYEVVDWKIVILLAGAISLGVEMGKTGFP